MKEKRKYKYFAFISYKKRGEDEEWAKWFQHELESYHLPSTLNGIDDLPESFRPVFRDDDELEAGDLSEQIQDALEGSLYLVVICSPRSAKSEWVNLEINTFIKIGKRHNMDNVTRIFPFIIEGIPYSEEKDIQCFPKELIELREKGRERLGGNVNESSREKAFVKVLAGMLPKEVTFAMLWDRYERDKIEEERKAREQNYKLLKAQGRAVAHHAKIALANFDYFLARRLALEIVTQNINKEIDILPEIESVLRFSSNNESSILVGHVAAVNSAIYSNDNSLVASCSDDKSIIIWDESTGTLIKRLIGHKGYVKCISFGKTADFIYSGSTDGAIYRWNIQNEEFELIVQEEFSIICLLYLKHQDIIVYYAGKGTIKFIDCKTCQIIRVLNVAKGSITSLSTNSSNSVLAISSHADIILVNLVSFETTAIASEHKAEITNISFSPDEISILSTSRDGTIQLWNIKEKTCYHHLVGHKGVVWDAQFHPTLPIIASVSADKTVCLWDIATPVFEIYPLQENIWEQCHQNQIFSISYNKDGSKFLTASADTIVRNFSLKSNLNLSNCVPLCNCEITCILASDELSELIVGDCLGRILFISKSDFQFIKSVQIANSEINSIVYAPNINSLIICSMGDYKIRLYNLESSGIWYEIEHVCSKFCTIDEAYNRLYFVEGNDVTVYSLDAKRIVTKLKGHTKYVNHLCLDKNKSCLYTSSEDATVRVWDINSFECKKVLSHSILGYTVMDISSNGHYIAVASEGHDVVIWDTETYKILSTLQHSQTISSITFFESERSIVTSSYDQKLCIWDIESGELLNSYYHDTLQKPDHYSCANPPLEAIIKDSWITDIGISEKETTIYSSSILGYLYAWKYEKTETLVDKYEQQFARIYFNEEERKRFYLL